MGWFENQIEERREADQQLLEDSFVRVAGVVLGKRSAQKFRDDRIVVKNAIDEILRFYHYKTLEIPENIKTPEEQLDYCLRPYGLMRRDVKLTGKWYNDAFGPFLAFTREGDLPVALLPSQVMGYSYLDPRTGRKVRVTRETAALLKPDAICFYRPLPQKKLGIHDLLLYMKRCLSYKDTMMITVFTTVISLVGLIMPRLTKALTGPVRESGQVTALIGVAICMVCVSLSTQLLTSVKGLLQSRLQTKLSLGIEASMMMRLLSLPASFFREYSPGELKSRSMSVSQLCSMLLSMLMS